MVTKTPFAATVHPRARRNGSIAFDLRWRQQGDSKTLAFETQKQADRARDVMRQVGPEEALKWLDVATAGTPTVEEFAAKYITGKSGIEGRTSDSYRSYMRLHITPTLGHLPIDAVTYETIAQWINLRAGEGAASKSIKNEHGFLSAMFQSAVDDGIAAKNPCGRSRLPETEREEMVFLSADEFAALLSYIPSKYQPLVLLLATTGLRWGEATALRRTDFDLEAKTVRVSRAWKRSEAQGHYIGAPKTKRSRRTVSVPDEALAALTPLLETGQEYVFTNTFGHPVRQANFHGAVWAPARRMANGLSAFEKAKADPDQDWVARTRGVWADRKPAATPIGKEPRIHDLRHSHASWLLKAGVPIHVVSRRLGHESITTTVDVYGHVAEEQANMAGQVIGVVLAGSMPQITN